MAKKTVRATSKPSQQKSKEDQWRKRMAAQAQVGTAEYPGSNGTGSAVAEPDQDVLDASTDTDIRVVPASAATAPAASNAAAASTSTTRTTTRTTSTAAASTAARRSFATGPRNRFGQANVMTIDQEMTFIKHDIRKLVILTIVCFAVLIALAFIVPAVIK